MKKLSSYNRWENKLRRTLFVLMLVAVPVVAMLGNGDDLRPEPADEEVSTAVADVAEPAPTLALSTDSAAPASNVVHSLVTRIGPGRLKDIFNDSNHVQLTAAVAGGIDPITNLADAYNLKHPVVRVHTCDAYMVDSLYNSMPYLVPHAAKLLAEIGHDFSDTIKARGGKAYRIKVTSLTRTDYSVSKLRRHNRNATDNSCHRYGTTFDVSWSKFDCQDSSYIVSLADLKNILAEIMRDKRDRGLCYVKFESKQGCFHVTARPVAKED